MLGPALVHGLVRNCDKARGGRASIHQGARYICGPLERGILLVAPAEQEHLAGDDLDRRPLDTVPVGVFTRLQASPRPLRRNWWQSSASL